jgi:hypothetical protein
LYDCLIPPGRLERPAKIRAISPGVCGAQLERVLAVVQIAKLDIPVDGIEVVREEQEVLDVRATVTLQPDFQRTRRHGLADNGKQRSVTRVEHRGDIDLDHDAQDVLAEHRRVALRRERELPGDDRFPRLYAVEEERIQPNSSEDAQAVGLSASVVVHAERGDLSGRGCARAFLHTAAITLHGHRKTAAENVLLLVDGKRRSRPARGDRHWSQADAVVDRVRKKCRHSGERKHIQHQD